MIKNHLKEERTKGQNINNCRVFSLGETKFAECLSEGPNSCSYALPFGYCFLCQHPRVNEILENTIRTKEVNQTS